MKVTAPVMFVDAAMVDGTKVYAFIAHATIPAG